MSASTAFLLAAGVLLLVVLALLLWPLLRSLPEGRGVERRAANLAIFREAMQALENERDEGELSEAGFAEARQELQRRLLEDTRCERAEPPGGHGRRTALAVLFLLPVAAAGGYAWLGQPQALEPQAAQAALGEAQINLLLDRLVEKLKASPDDAQGWVMLARTYKALGRFSESAEAYGHAGARIDASAALLADYAEVRVRAGGGRFDRQTQTLIERALRLDPEDPQALFLAGAAASERKDYSAVARHWGRLLPKLDPASEEARHLGDAVAKAREMAEPPRRKPAAR